MCLSPIATSMVWNDKLAVIMDSEAVRDVPDVVFDLDVRPYQYEPILEHGIENSSGDEEEESSETEAPLDVNIGRLGNTDWCDCGECIPMPTGLESKCCQEIQQTERMCDEESVQCITEHPYFVDNCLRRGVVWVSLLEFAQQDGPLDDNEPIHEAYRYCSYRRFSRLVYHTLPKKCRKVHPSCVVKKN
ncbi:uncharacterized protein [Haliotis asinina]|uniref:uncharacterized protein n=1 Tax=Haliotis asinina TaxID=109174 RepID=UPI00353182E5